ncbi:hypothetical protein ACEPAG_6876 [Sanghuangporus baumii]
MSTPMNIQHRRTPSMTCFAPQPTHARSLSGQLATSWSDGFEFTSCSPLTSALHLGTSPPMGNVYLPSTAAQLSMSCSPRGDYSSFERDYCTNFACCGITLPDMHALVAHFEETHLGASEGAPFVSPQSALYVPVPQPKSLLQVNTNNTTGTDTGAKGTAAIVDAPSPNSSIGPETPPPSSHVSAYGFPMNGQPHLQLQVQTQLYSNGFRANSASPYPHSPLSTHSPYSASPLSAGSPASLGSIDQQQSEHSSGSGEELEMDMDMDVLMSFDPLDNVNGVHTPLDSTPPSPLAAPIRPSSVLRGHALMISGGQPDALPVCLPPSLFSAPIPSPTLLSPNVEKDSSAKKEKKDRKERERERKGRAESPASSAGDASATSSSGGAVRREKTRKAASSAMSLLGLGSSSRSSISSSSDEGSSVNGESAAVVEEKSKGAVVEKPRAERTGRPERPDKSGKRTREKAYKCPKPGCTKSYLNPNGLKYHCAKGTCTFADGTSAPPTPVTPTTPAIPSIASVSIPSTPAVPSASNANSNVSTQPVVVANACSVNQPLTPTSLPSSPRMHNQFSAAQGQGMYEYHHLQQQQQYQEQYVVANGVVNMNMNVSNVGVGNVNLNDVPIIAAPVRTMRWR